MAKVYAAVKAIIQKDNKFLVIKQGFDGKSVWDLPGGRVNFGESPYDTLAREVNEEVHLSVYIVKPLGLFWFFRYDGDQVVCFTFLCATKNFEIDLTKNPANENVIKYKWVTKEEFLSDEYVVLHDSLKKLFTLL